MTIFNRHQFSIFLMSSSLVLLSIFLSLWLNRVYQDELNGLKKETNHLFFNSIRDIESDYVNKLFLEPVAIAFTDSMDKMSGSSKFIKTVQKDSTKVVTMMKGQKNQSWQSDSAFQLRISAKSDEAEGEKMVGSLSVFIEMSEDRASDSLTVDGKFPFHQDTNITALLDKHIKKGMLQSDLPVEYKVIHLTEGDSLRQVVFSSAYTDLASGESYAVELSEYRPFLLKEMLPEILFSLVLFSIISLAFFLIYQSLQHQRRLTQLKNDFISNVTHELKTPITTVSVAIEALSNFNALQNPKRTQEYLDISKQELNRLGILVDKVLKMSLFEQNKPELKIETLDLQILLHEILNSMRLQFEKFTANVQVQFLGANFLLEGDRIHLTSVIYNLLDNALKYSPNQPDIQIALENVESEIKMSVRDHGIGISQEFKEKVFEKFFRVPTGNMHNVKGHGLGLSYVASVVQQHQGKIWVESEKGSGTRFVVSLPKKQ